MMTGNEDTITLRCIEADVRAADFDHAAWVAAPAVRLSRYYSGELALPGRHAEVLLLWTPQALCVRFRATQTEPLVVSAAPQTATKTLGLWERDVCEIFVAPEAKTPEHYFEFEVAPTGEWVDLEIEWKAAGRTTNSDYASGMQAAGRFAEGEVWAAMCIPWRAFGRTPQAGETWRVNLFRCVGRDTEIEPRGYLAWQPTYTLRPNFHVPAAFGWLRFEGNDE